jgi:hypothetical protein
MGKILGSAGLILIALFMLVGFLRADLATSALATTIAFLIAVGLPAAGGVALLSSHFGSARRLGQRRELLRRHTLNSEVLRLAAQRGGKITVVEVVTELSVSPDAAKESLDELAMQELAEIQIADSGMLVYAFADVQNLAQKARAKGVLDD